MQTKKMNNNLALMAAHGHSSNQSSKLTAPRNTNPGPFVLKSTQPSNNTVNQNTRTPTKTVNFANIVKNTIIPTKQDAIILDAVSEELTITDYINALKRIINLQKFAE